MIWGVHLKKIFIIFLIIGLLFITNTVESFEENSYSIIYISPVGDGNFTKIQDGIDAAEPGDIVYVYNGTYFENIVIDKTITLVGEDKQSTVIDGRSVGNTIKVNADNVTIKNFTITHSGLIYPLSGINLSSNYNTIEDNIITDNFYGITLYFSSGNTIIGNTIQNDDHCGIYISSSKNNFFINNLIRNNNFNGIGLYYSSDNNTIKNNNFVDNRFCAVNIRISSNNNVVGNNFSDNNIGIYIPNYSNTESNNSFSDNGINVEREFVFSENLPILLFVFAVIIFIFVIISYIIFRKKKKIN